MTAHGRSISDLLAMRGQQVEVETVDVTEDVDGVPSWVMVDREKATVIISERLMMPPRPEIPADAQPEFEGSL